MMTPKTKAQATTQEERARAERSLKRRSTIVRQSKALLPYGTPEELAEMVRRVRFMVPGGDRLTDREVYALAQAAYAHGLNPIIGECWWVNGSFMPGIRGLRRKARDQVSERYGSGEHYTIERFEFITSNKKRAEWKIPEGALAFEAHLVISKELREYAERMKTIRDALGRDAPWEMVLELAGPRPVTIGIGYVTAEEMEQLDNPRWYHKCKDASKNTTRKPTKSGGYWQCRELRGFDPCPDCGEESTATPPKFSHVQRAQKRAEAHALKQKFDLPFEIDPTGSGLADEVDEEIVEGAWEDLSEVPDSLKTGEELERWRELQKEQSHREEAFAEMSPEKLHDEAMRASEALLGGVQETQITPKSRQKPPAKKAEGVVWPERYTKALLESEALPPGSHPRHAIALLNLIHRVTKWEPKVIGAPAFVRLGEIYRGVRIAADQDERKITKLQAMKEAFKKFEEDVHE